MGRVDILLQLLRRAGLDQPRELAHYAVQVNPNALHKPVADQILEHVLRDNPSLEGLYEQIEKETHDSTLELARQSDMALATQTAVEP